VFTIRVQSIRADLPHSMKSIRIDKSEEDEENELNNSQWFWFEEHS